MDLKQGVFFLLICGGLFWSSSSFGLSEAELESLAESGSKSVTKSSWRRKLSLSLIRNLDFKSGYLYASSWCDPNKSGSLCDPENLYYRPRMSLYYSLKNLGQKINSPDFFKKTELFITTGFQSNFSGGYCKNLPERQNKKGNITFLNYIDCGLMDIIGGWTTPIYQKQKFHSFFDFSALIYPLSQRSQDKNLKNSFTGSLSFLYFLKTKDKQRWMLSSSHELNYNSFTSLTVDKTGLGGYNIPLTTTQTLNLIATQSFNPYLPANSKIFASYTFGLDTHMTNSEQCLKNPRLLCGDRKHYLALGASSSWQAKKNFFISLSASWKNLVQTSNPLDEKVYATQPWSLAFNHWYFSLTGSYTF